MHNSHSQIMGSADVPFGIDTPLAQYIHALPEDAIARMHQPASDAAKLMQMNLIGMLGHLPSEAFDVNITTSREMLGQLMASAMSYGYFLHTAEQRMALENSFPHSDS